ncbi:MAG: phosphoglycerate dehydrogenase [Candidatus Omnitrophica bacterium]|nr:phosphoglycerate dehydrogenase [Candidatus Omnitrophota bacterium]
MTQKYRVLVMDGLNRTGIEILRKEPAIRVDERERISPPELKKIASRYDAIVVRSQTEITRDILERAKRLKVVGRAGVGMDNIDVKAATKRGVVVMNSPGGNTISTAEHTLSMLLALSRNIPQANASLHESKWNRSQFTGVELYGKVLGVVGLGRIGREVAHRARAFGMKVIASDPFISKEKARQLEIELVDLKTVLARSDYISLHVPLTPETRHMLGAAELKRVKTGVRIINCARGGLIDEQALVKALKAKRVGGAAVDVFEEEPPHNHPLLKFDNVIATPHLGAATSEAQVHVAQDIAQQVADCLLGRGVRNAINMPWVDPSVAKSVEPYVGLAEKIGHLEGQLVGERFQRVEIRYSGEVTAYDLAPMTLAVLKGLMTPLFEQEVNFVNAPLLAKERGIRVTETKSSQVEDYANLITVEIRVDHKVRLVAGTLFGRRVPRIVRIDEYHVDAVPSGHMLFIQNRDRPGMIGMIGTLLGRNKINIADMTLGRGSRGGIALTVLNVDNVVPPRVLARIRRHPHIVAARLVKL